MAGLTCVFLAGRNSKYNFWVGYLYSALLFLMFWNKALWANMLLQPISLGINILGHYRWTHPRPEEVSGKDGKSLKVSMLTWTQRAIAIAAIFALGWLWGWLLETLTHDPVPYLDACVTALILVAQFLSALKKWDCWIAWLAVNITQIILAHIRRPCIHAHRMCTLPYQRSRLARQLVPPLPQQGMSRNATTHKNILYFCSY